MAKLTHKQKVRMARKMMTPEEIRNHVSIWESAAWLARSGRAGRVRAPRVLDLAALSRGDKKAVHEARQPWLKRFFGRKNITSKNSLPQKVV